MAEHVKGGSVPDVLGHLARRDSAAGARFSPGGERRSNARGAPDMGD